MFTLCQKKNSNKKVKKTLLLVFLPLKKVGIVLWQIIARVGKVGRILWQMT